MSFKEIKFVKQNWLRWVKWWPNVFERDQSYETDVFAVGQMMTKCPSKRPYLLNRIGCDGPNDDQMSLKETKFINQNWFGLVKWWPIFLQGDKIYEIEFVAMGQMMTKCLSKRPHLLNRIGCDGSNDDQMSLKETIFMKQKCSRRMKWMGKCPVALVIRWH